MNDAARTVNANGLTLPAMGQGGWRLGDDPQRAANEIAALRRGVELGLALVDTAEMYGDGRSELLIGEALRGVPRESYRLVSKVYPHNAGRSNIFKSCDASLKRLQTDHLDLYLLHWRGAVPLRETVECMEELKRAGKILRWGVSNFDAPDMEELWNTPGGGNCAADQVLYHLGSRGIEYDLLPWLRARHGCDGLLPAGAGRDACADAQGFYYG
jgi:diketogulonate reductase-like aldo/keto reductase